MPTRVSLRIQILDYCMKNTAGTSIVFVKWSEISKSLDVFVQTVVEQIFDVIELFVLNTN